MAQEVARYYADPLGFVLAMWEWGKGRLARFSGPDKWQREYLIDLGEQIRDRGFDGRSSVRAIRKAVPSGHGIGKSTLSAWLVCWCMATRPFTHGIATSMTDKQLQTKLWAAVRDWHSRSPLMSRWFEVNAERFFHPRYRDAWFVVAQTCKAENSEAFAGQHAIDSTSLYLFDEGSGIPDTIYETAEGGLTDGEPMWFLFGNPTRNTGQFYRNCFGDRQHRWTVQRVDSRESAFTNKEQIREWVEDNGEDSDFVRVRVRGLAPRTTARQFIDQERVDAAKVRNVVVLAGEPLLCGLDVSRGGEDRSVWRFRRGLDARTVPSFELPGTETRDSTILFHKSCEILDDRFNGQQVERLFIDGAGVGGGTYDRLVEVGFSRRVSLVDFGGKSPDRVHGNMRAFIWGRAKEWLRRGSLPTDPQLAADLVGPEYHYNTKNRIILEEKALMKKRGLPSPDDADALTCTFAHPIRSRFKREVQKQRRQRFEGRRGQQPGASDGQGWMR